MNCHRRHLPLQLGRLTSRCLCPSARRLLLEDPTLGDVFLLALLLTLLFYSCSCWFKIFAVMWWLIIWLKKLTRS